MSNKKRKDYEDDYSEEENEYDIFLNNLTEKKRNKLIKLEEKLVKIEDTVPLRYKILTSNIEKKIKSQILQKVLYFETLSPLQDEYFKIKKYIDGIMNIPFGKLSKLPVKKEDKIEKIQAFIKNIKHKLDLCIYGQNLAKENLLQIVSKWITNPKSTGNVIGLCGPPGIGKTSIIKNGLSKALDIPFSFITLGGSTHSSSLTGFEFTYENSKWGRIAEILMESKCMNPIIFFDELDKISGTKSGEDITSLLIHLTDNTQNNNFNDKYFSGIDLDLSKAFIIFSFNEINNINPILRDRIDIINLEGFNTEEKIKIANDYSLDKICQNIGIERKKIIIPDETLRVIIVTYCPEKGIRNLEKCLETLIMKINLFDLTKDMDNLIFERDLILTEPYHITIDIATKLLDPYYRKNSTQLLEKMMYS